MLLLPPGKVNGFLSWVSIEVVEESMKRDAVRTMLLRIEAESAPNS